MMPVGSQLFADDRDGPFADLKIESLCRILSDRGSTCTNAVGLIRDYSKRPDVGDDLKRARYRLGKAVAADTQSKRLSVASTGRKPRVWSMEERLSPETITAMIADYRAGSIGKEIAEKYGISLSSVRRLMRKHGGRLKDSPDIER